MEEKILIQSESYNVKKFFKKTVIIGIVLSVLMFCFSIASNMSDYDYYYERYLDHQGETGCGWYYEEWEKCWSCEEIEASSSKLGYAIARTFEYYDYLICLIPVASLALIGGLVYLWLRSYELTVTDKRIYGKVAWGKRVDLPVDSVSATATIRLFKGVSVSTSSGRISFRVIKNADEIYTVISNLLIERQQKQANIAAAANAPVVDDAEQLKKFKDLLDSGVITQEEFDAKKKQLLGL